MTTNIISFGVPDPGSKKDKDGKIRDYTPGDDDFDDDFREDDDMDDDDFQEADDDDSGFTVAPAAKITPMRQTRVTTVVVDGRFFIPLARFKSYTA